MNDKIITKVIPKIHLRVALFLFFTFLVVFFTFIALLEGFRIDHLTFAGVKVEQLYLKWDKALLIKASKIDLSDIKPDSTPFTLKSISKLPTYVRWIEHWIESANINTIQYKDLRGSLFYQKNSPGLITVQEGNTTYSGTFSLDDTLFTCALPRMHYRNGEFSGYMSVRLKERKLLASLKISLPETPNLRVNALGHTDNMSINVHADHEFTTLKPLIRFLGVSADVAPWIDEYAKISSVDLRRLSSTFHYNKPEELLINLRGEAAVTTGEYTFAQGIDPIKAPLIDLQFRDGKLYIFPKQGTFYAHPTERSYLYIDFLPEHTVLKAFIQTHHAMLNDPILGLLRHYEINLPIKQTSGECSVDLNLTVNLHSFDTTAAGVFQPTPSGLLLDQIPLRSEGGIVKLDNTRVRFENFIAHYGDNIANARVKGEYDAHDEHGIVTIDAYDISPLGNNRQLTLSGAADPLRISYLISPDHDTLSVSASKWNLLGETLKIDPFQTAFDYHQAFASVQSVPFSISNKVHGYFNALFNGTQKKTDVHLHLTDLNLGEVTLSHTPLDIDLHNTEAVTTLQSPQASAWSIHKLSVLISPFNAYLKNDEITFDHIETVLGDILKGSFTGAYRLNAKQGSIHLSNMVPLNPKIVPLIESKESVDLTLDASGEEIALNANALKAHFSTIPQGWKVSLDDISLLSKRSPILRRYHIDNGFMDLFYTGESSKYTFNGEINYPFSLMVINDEPTSRYRFSGVYRNEQSTLRINDRLILTHTPDGIMIRANNAGINMPQLSKFLSEHQDTNSSKEDRSSDSLPIRINATHTYLYLMKGHKIVADVLDATLDNNDLDASLHHMLGSATLRMRNGLFSIDGHDFNDKFMEHLFTFSDFYGGTFSFQAKGDSDSFEGIMRIENTILKDYKLLNNVLAFINTVPSLATFSLPNYNTLGLPVKDGYAHFAYSKGKINVDNFTLNSPEIKILGEGRADLKAETILASLTLKTDLGSKLAKVPMVGYILFGEDGSISTTVTVSGKLDNPKVETAIAKEIVTAPFNILRRTLVYPFLWMLPDEKKK